jgi:hypothetical protein
MRDRQKWISQKLIMLLAWRPPQVWMVPWATCSLTFVGPGLFFWVPTLEPYV